MQSKFELRTCRAGLLHKHRPFLAENVGSLANLSDQINAKTNAPRTRAMATLAISNAIILPESTNHMEYTNYCKLQTDKIIDDRRRWFHVCQNLT